MKVNEETEKIFKTFKMVIGSLGLGAAEINGVFLALEHMIAKGVVKEHDYRQLGQHIPGEMSVLANLLGVSIEELVGMMNRNEVVSVEVLPRLAKAFEDGYGIG